MIESSSIRVIPQKPAPPRRPGKRQFVQRAATPPGLEIRAANLRDQWIGFESQVAEGRKPGLPKQGRKADVSPGVHEQRKPGITGAVDLVQAADKNFMPRAQKTGRIRITNRETAITYLARFKARNLPQPAIESQPGAVFR